jgi:hypothetical protein
VSGRGFAALVDGTEYKLGRRCSFSAEQGTAFPPNDLMRQSDPRADTSRAPPERSLSTPSRCANPSRFRFNLWAAHGIMSRNPRSADDDDAPVVSFKLCSRSHDALALQDDASAARTAPVTQPSTLCMSRQNSGFASCCRKTISL